MEINAFMPHLENSVTIDTTSFPVVTNLDIIENPKDVCFVVTEIVENSKEKLLFIISGGDTSITGNSLLEKFQSLQTLYPNESVSVIDATGSKKLIKNLIRLSKEQLQKIFVESSFFATGKDTTHCGSPD